MRSAVSLTLVASLMTAAVPIAAQEKRESPESFDLGSPTSRATAGRFTRAVTREAIRLAGTSQPSTSIIETVQQGGEAAESSWSPVLKLAPATGIVVTVKGSQPTRRYFVAGDASHVTVLNLDDPALPTAISDVLRGAASSHPEYFPAAQRGGQFIFEKNVRLGPDGVFVAGRKVADLAQVVEQYGRRDIAEIKTAGVESNAVGCVFAGYYGGAILGGLPGGVIGGAVGRDTGPALLGMMVGWSAGAVHVYRKCRHTPEKVIYDAP